MDWKKWLNKTASMFVASAMASTSAVATAPGLDINSTEGAVTIGTSTLIMAGLTALSNWLKHRD